MSRRVLQFTKDLEKLRDTLSVPHEADTHSALTRMLAVCRLKFAWVDDLPFLIWQADSPRTASWFLRKCAESRDPPHRVTLRFSETDLSTAMKEWANGGVLADTLNTELRVYRNCKLDDTWAEACHRDVSRESKRNTRASQGWVSASLRLQQNLAVFDALPGPTVRRASIMFQRWKAIAQVNARRANLLVRRKAPSKTVLQFVYRSGQYALEDWSSRLRHALGIGKRIPIVRAIPFDMRLKLDLLDRVLVQGTVFSVPRTSHHAVGEEEARLSLVTADAVLHARSESLSYFVLVEKHVRRRKLPCTGTALGFQRMDFPACVQSYIPVHDCPQPSLDLALRPSGAAQVWDLMQFADWDVWRGGLRQLPRIDGAMAGTINTGVPELVSQREWDVGNADTPAIVVLERLVDQGWCVGTPPLCHTLTSARIFQWKEQMSEKSYWQCLANLDILCAKGLEHLPIGKPSKYYAQVLTAHRPHEVPCIGDVDVVITLVAAQQSQHDKNASGCHCLW